MPFVPINVVNGSTAANATWGNNVQVQYTEATNSFNQDEYTPFVLSGLIASKDNVTASKLDITAGVAYVLQSDSTTRRRAVASTSQTTSAVSSTYYLYVQPDGTLYWATTNTPASNSLFIAQVTTDGSGNIASVTDKRTLSTTLFNGKDANLGALTMPAPLSLRQSQNGSLAGAVIGGVTFGQVGALANDLDTAALFNGSTGTILAPGGGGLPTGNGAWSLECWVNVAATPATVQVLLFMGTVAAHQAAQLYFAGSGLLTLDTDVAGSALANAAVSVNTWHHVVGTWDGTTLKMYIDNVLQTQTGAPGAASLGVTAVSLGSQAGSTFFFNGQMAKAAYYGSTLSAARITAHYNARTGGGYDAAVLSDSPLRYYRLAETAGATLAADTISPVVNTLVDAGGTLRSIGGQASAGGLGAPVIVAQALHVSVTATTNQSILAYTAPAAGLYRVSGYVSQNNNASTTITAQVGSTDADTNNTVGQTFTWGTTAISALSRLAGTNSLAFAPIVIYVASGSVITCYWQDSAGAPADHVTYIIERMS